MENDNSPTGGLMVRTSVSPIGVEFTDSIYDLEKTKFDKLAFSCLIAKLSDMSTIKTQSLPKDSSCVYSVVVALNNSSDFMLHIKHAGALAKPLFQFVLL